ncbi:conserved hypothetical protein [Anaeromyxobacter sp. K]|uniref:hypothetical protein n=1 Tax=Anaeromyxobacter sp. (strain K) TaxID=447217 RepID=UPI00015F87BD|nr:hypothetical protein [Anaeromyxobacter sp. K]ACG71608.1 conserved hypothetical protein [Anaeromyxobacter sp. K]
MTRLLKAWRVPLAVAAAVALTAMASPSAGAAALRNAAGSTREMLGLLPPVLLLIGLLEVWVPREVIVRNVGAGAGLRGVLIPLALGSVAAGPLYAAFPLAAVLLAKGARPANVFFFLGVWSGAKLPILMFEAGVMGAPFTALHVGIGLLGAYAFALVIERLLCPDGPGACAGVGAAP